MISSSSPTRVLIVDDEPDLRKVLTFNLESAGFLTEAAANGRDGLVAARRTRPVVVILDVMLPDLSGIDVCRELRAGVETSDIAILMLTARGDEAGRVLGFEVGADDYVLKPFSVREVVMRVRVLARRAQERDAARAVSDDGKRLRWKGLEIDPLRHRANTDGSELLLRPLEFKLLSLFLEHPGRVFSRKELLVEVWGISPSTNTRTVDVHVRRLRASLGTYGKAIETIHGVGYRLSDPERWT